MISNAIFLANKPFILPLSLSLSLSLSLVLFFLCFSSGSCSGFISSFVCWFAGLFALNCLLVCLFWIGFLLDPLFVLLSVLSFFLYCFSFPSCSTENLLLPSLSPPPHLPPPAQDRRISPGVVRMLVRAARHQVASIRWSPGTFARFNLPNRGPVSSILPPLPFNWASNNVARNSNN